VTQTLSWRAAIVAFVVGVMGVQQLAQLPQPYWLWGMPLLASVWALPRQGGWRVARLTGFLLCWIALGVAWATWRADLRLADNLPATWAGVPVMVSGVVSDLPVRTDRGQHFEFNVDRVLTPGAQVPSSIQLSLYSAHSAGAPAAPPVQVGQCWQWMVRLNRPHASQNPHVMDMESVRFANDVRAMGVVGTRPQPQLLAAWVNSPMNRINLMREDIAQRIDRALPNQPYAGVLKALTVGDQSAIPAAQWQLFQRTGIVHLISISGSHITMLAGLAYFVCFWSWRRIPRLSLWLPAQRAATLAGALTALAYVALAGFGIPAQRTLLMLAVAAWALWTGRTLAPTRVLAAALFAVVLLDPWAVLSPGFWLSFGAVGLLMFSAGARVGEVHWLQAWWRSQWAVTMGMAPVLLLLFGQLSTVSPLANVVAIPAIEFVITPVALLGSIPGLGILLHVAHAGMSALVWLLQILATWPLWQQAEPSPFVVGLAMLGALWWLLPRGFPARWLGAFCLLPALLVQAPVPATGAMWVETLDIGQGLAVLVRTAHHNYLFDTGPRYGPNSDSGGRIILPYLRGEGVTQLDTLVLSHDDNDHTGGAGSILAAMPVDKILTPLPTDHVLIKPYVQHYLRCETGLSWAVDGVNFHVLHPDVSSYADPTLKDNHRGCVLKVDSPGGSVLLTADIEAPDEAYLLQHPADLPSDLLLAPHHGSHTSSTPAFITAVHPKWVIFTVGAHNRFGHPHGDVVARYANQGIAMWRSDWNGEVSFHFTPKQAPTMLAWRQAHQRYWMDGASEE